MKISTKSIQLVCQIWTMALVIAIVGLSGTPGYSDSGPDTRTKIKLIEALDVISEEYQIFFSYKPSLVKDIVIEFDLNKEHSLEYVLDAVLRQTNLKYDYVGNKFCVIYENSKAGRKNVRKVSRKIQQIQNLEAKGKIQIQSNQINSSARFKDLVNSKIFEKAIQVTKSITGKVTDEEDIPLIGATIQVKGTSVGTSTNVDGEFNLDVPDDATILVISYIGYTKQEISINDQSVIIVSLQKSTSILDEIVVVGYGTQRKVDLTGAVSSISSGKIKDVPATSVSDVLNGRIAGINVTPSDGKPGSGSEILIRGVNTLNNSSPLIVIDGIPIQEGGAMEALNPTDIESVSVLKDASAAAIYGARAANGVILITTKRGKVGKGVIKVNSYYGWQNIGYNMDVTNASQFVTLQNEARANSGLSILFPNNPDSYGVGSDWIGEYFESAPQQNHNVSFRGGTKGVSYFVSGGYLDREGIAPETGYERINFRSNLDLRLSDKLKIGNSVSLTSSNQYGKNGQAGEIFFYAPTIPIYDAEGNPVQGQHAGEGTANAHPIINQQLGENHRKQFRLLGNAFAEYNVTENLRIKANANVDVANGNNFSFKEVFDFVGWENTLAGLNTSRSQHVNWNADILAYFDKVFNGIHTINAMVGYTVQETDDQLLSGSRSNFVNNEEAQYVLAAGLENQLNSGSRVSSAYNSYLARINYNYKGKYLFAANFRADGSSKFAPANRWGYFPSFSGAWRLSEEDFFNIDGVSNLKIRASWGTLGNDKIPPYSYTSLLSLSSFKYILGAGKVLTSGAGATSLSNPDIQWETTVKTNFGIDLTILKDKLNLTAEFWNHKIKDMLFRKPLGQTVGLQPAFTNDLEMKSQGVELILDYNDNIGDFYYNVGLNIGTSKNEVTNLAGEEFNSISLSWNGQARHAVGQEAFSFYGFEMDGIFQSVADVESSPTQAGAAPGAIKFKDLDNDGDVDSDDRTYLGSHIPRLTYGFNLNANWKNFDFSMFWQGVEGKKQFTPRTLWGNAGHRNYSSWWYDNRWHGEGTSNTAPALKWEGGQTMSDFLIQDVSYLRLKNMSIGYRFDLDNLSSIRVYVAGQNLITFSDYIGLDPESAGLAQYNAWGQGYPNSKVYSLGVNLTF